MTVKYGFYDSLNGDRLYNANDINTFFEGIFSDGVFEFVGNGLKVEPNPGSMSVLVRDGRAWFNNTWIRNTATLTLPITPSHMVLDRIDLVILEFDSSITVRENSIKVLTGTPSATPIPPVLANTSTLHQYALAHIYVAASVSEIEIGDITNKIGTVNTPYAKSLISEPYIPPVTTEINDFQAGDGFGNWVKKTLAQTRTILQVSPVLYDNTLSVGNAQFDITGIPSGYAYLELIYTLRQSSGGIDADIILNNDTSELYNQLKVVIPSGGITISDTYLLGNKFSLAVGTSTDLTGYAGSGKITIPNYDSTVFTKTMQAVTSRPINDSAGLQRLFNYHLMYKSTSPITSITIKSLVGNTFIAGSRVTLIGIK
jgi:hypothetical protein